MSFRLRVLAVVLLVAVCAVAATAYLAYLQAARQVNQTAAADQHAVTTISGELTNYAYQHGTWEGVGPTLLNLKSSTGQRIKLLTESGAVVADTDTLEGRTPRPVNVPPILVNPLPSVDLATTAGEVLASAAQRAITRYRTGVQFAACLTRLGLGAVVSPGDYRVPEYAPDPAAGQDHSVEVRHCRATAEADAEGKKAADTAAVVDCHDTVLKLPHGALESRVPTPSPPSTETEPPSTVETTIDLTGPTDRQEARKDLALSDCLRKAFISRTADVAPPALRVYLGAVDDPKPSPLQPGPVVAAAVLVALLAVAVTLLLSRRVLRPIGTLTAASRGLGEGDLTRRVPARGRDELAELARSFNRMADSLQRGEERQRRLVADVAHELRTPLANLRGYLEALKDGVIPADPALFASLHEEAVLQQRIVDDLQDLALAEAGTLAYHRTAVDLAELLETCRTAAQTAADAAGVTIRVDAPHPVVVTADPDRLRQVIGNLIANSLRATPAGGTITLSATAAPDPTVTVRDTGTGIAAADLPHIFDRFWRADPARGRTTGGSGLGLAIARQIVTDHRGHITAHSTPGIGTSITILLPER
jgi:two-component system sensor histidine kinase BaeS